MANLTNVAARLQTANVQEVARVAGLDPATVYRIKRGSKHSPVQRTVDAVDAALKAIARRAKPARMASK